MTSCVQADLLRDSRTYNCHGHPDSFRNISTPFLITQRHQWILEGVCPSFSSVCCIVTTAKAPLWWFSVWSIEPITSGMLGKCCVTEPQCQSEVNMSGGRVLVGCSEWPRTRSSISRSWTWHICILELSLFCSG